MEGNALAVCCRLGMAGNKRVRHLVDVLRAIAVARRRVELRCEP